MYVVNYPLYQPVVCIIIYVKLEITNITNIVNPDPEDHIRQVHACNFQRLMKIWEELFLKPLQNGSIAEIK